jgi:two-component system alkaline phosphatase synthesis response regulator PhoP
MKKILIVEDDPAILKGLISSLESEGYSAVSSMDGEEGFKLGKTLNIDLIILDVMLPKKDGFEICGDLRKSGINTPILMLTSKKEEIDKVLGLEIGADDYMTKPFSIRELLARIKAILRRKNEITKSVDEFSFNGIHLDFKKMEAFKDNEQVKLSSLEFKILKYFIEREGEVISRDKLLDDVWGYETFPTTRTVDNYILSIRKKIENDPSEPVHIITVPKSGYKFVK